MKQMGLLCQPIEMKEEMKARQMQATYSHCVGMCYTTHGTQTATFQRDKITEFRAVVLAISETRFIPSS
jgi:hypothetical protein